MATQDSCKYDDSDSKISKDSLELSVKERCVLEHDKQPQDDPFDFSLSNSSSFDYLSLMEAGYSISTTQSQYITDQETAEALLEFEELVAQSSYLDQIPPIDHANRHVIKHNESVHKDWDNLNEQELLQRFKEQYKADRLHATSSRLYSQSALIPDMKLKECLNCDDKKSKVTSLSNDLDAKRCDRIGQLTNYDAVEDELDKMLPDFDMLISQKHRHQQQLDVTQNEVLHNSTKNILSKQLSSTNESTLRLEDLANLSAMTNVLDSNQAHAVAVAMDNLDGMTECITSKSKERINHSTANATLVQKPTTWTAKYTLRSHFDAIRGIVFHPSESVLVTCSEDHTLKLWNLNKTIQTKKSSMFDVEPIYTFRGHTSPVLSVAILASLFKIDNLCQSGLISPVQIYSGDLSGCIRSWYVSSLQLDPYDTFDISVIGPSFDGHTDAVWSLCSRYDGLLLSTSADGTSRLWHLRPNSFVSSDVYYISNMINKCENLSQQVPIPTSATFLWTNFAQFAAGFNSGHVCLFNLETHQIVRNFQSISKTDTSDTYNRTVCAVNSVISHPHLSLIISAHDDRQIRFWDSLSGKCVHSLTAHLDSVTTLSLDSKGTSLLSASHDCSIRIWDINTKLCIQEITGHRKKFGEAINAVAFHPVHHYMASAGSDALAKVYV
ncbi:Striatin [Schistosoma japonicum]|uniref:Striatin n=1 Tax=Schistosoma japonicum TaxID=6182 RepID=A0A4Z2DII8_SCHJA|nr:Striatin [Schistosoma japonicum]